jgi:hypothetical protein
MVDVAVKKLAVGEEVAVTTPLAFVERMELIAVPDTVIEGAEIAAAVMVPVAVIFAALMLPEARMLPCTPRAKRDEGVVVPRPRMPITTLVAVVDVAYMELVVTVDVAMRAVPAAFDTTKELPANEVELVPPFDTGRVPETSVARAT